MSISRKTTCTPLTTLSNSIYAALNSSQTLIYSHHGLKMLGAVPRVLASTDDDMLRAESDGDKRHSRQTLGADPHRSKKGKKFARRRKFVRFRVYSNLQRGSYPSVDLRIYRRDGLTNVDRCHILPSKCSSAVRLSRIRDTEPPEICLLILTGSHPFKSKYRAEALEFESRDPVDSLRKMGDPPKGVRFTQKLNKLNQIN